MTSRNSAASRNTAKRRVLAFLGVGSLVTTFLACASVAGIDKFAVGPCKGGEPCEDDGEDVEASARDRSTPGQDSDGDDTGVEPFSCPSAAPGPKMVQVGTASNPYCIDSTEVTVGQYKTFLASSPSTSDQQSECTWNTTYAPPSNSGTFTDDMPQVWVDWCDAVAYCKWAGKRLCGKIVDGQDPGTPLSKADLAGPTDQWYNACSGNGQKPYPYGTTLKSGTCNVLTSAGLKGLKAPGTFTGCVGGSDGIFDMVGNAWEWIDVECVTGADAGPGPENQACYSRGGSFGTAEADAKCSFNGTWAPRKGMNDQIGFRCCSQ